MSLPIRYVDDAQALDEAVAACRHVSVVSIDTEFMRSKTYYPIVGLVQIYDGTTAWLVDPVAIDDISPISSVLGDAKILKVFHACSEDLEVFERCLGTLPRPVFDTQIAGAAAGKGYSVGYQGLVEELLSVSIPKEETRSDWLQRPLTAKQIEYAALDVIYLQQMYNQLVELLSGTGKLEWIEEECEAVLEETVITTNPDKFYLRMKTAWRLDRQQLNVLKTLCAWREVTARRLDIPRNWVVDDKVLFTIAKSGLADKRDLKEKALMASGQIRKYGEEILALADQARQVPLEQCPPPVLRPARAPDTETMTKIQQMIDDKAQALNVSRELLARKKHLEQLFGSLEDNGGYRLPPILSGWRKKVIGDDLLKVLNEKVM
ncbi:MAG: ribonuclease D [Pseudomonadales bacterium]